MNRQRLAYIFAISAVLLWSTVASAFKISLRYIDIYQLLFLSSLVATLCLFIILLCQGKLSTALQLEGRDYLRLFVLGLLNPFCYYLVLFRAYALLPAQIAQSLNYTWAITLMLLSIPVLQHKVSKYDLLATAICYTGVVIICTGGSTFPSGSLNYFGIFLALSSTVIWASYWLLKTKDHIEPVTGLFYSFLFSLPLTATVWFIFSGFSTLNYNGLLGAVYVGLFEMGITFVLWLYALKLTTTAARISTLIFLAPFLSLFLIHKLVGEPIAETTFFGLILIVSGLIIQQKYNRTGS